MTVQKRKIFRKNSCKSWRCGKKIGHRLEIPTNSPAQNDVEISVSDSEFRTGQKLFSFQSLV